jgi:hypothetical protein
MDVICHLTDRTAQSTIQSLMALDTTVFAINSGTKEEKWQYHEKPYSIKLHHNTLSMNVEDYFFETM